ncbi:MAG: ferredoxin [Spirochaetes bacterium DG_61]|jgi:ferredoxin|nr:MAG: ferredoxin [Spirochaetes bacterium DG_61]
MKITIDREECTSCGLCWDECPGVFEENPDDGFSQIVDKYRVGENLAVGLVTGEIEECVSKAAGECPVEIIQIE